MGDDGWNRTGRKGASRVIVLLRPVQRLLDPAMALCLPGISARRGPPPGDGYPCQGLCRTALRSRCAASRPCHLPWEDIPARLVYKAMQEGRKFGRDGVRGLGLPVVDFRPPGLRFLDSSEGGGQTPQHL